MYEAYEERRRLYRSLGWWGDHSVLDWWKLAVKASPQACAIVDRQGRRYTYMQVEEHSSRLAGWMRDRGVAAGDVIAIQLPNWSQFLIALIGAYKVGAVVNPLSIQLRQKELQQAIEECGIRVAVMPSCFRTTDFCPIARDLRESSCLESVIFVSDGEHGCDLDFDQICRTYDPLPREEWAVRTGDDLAAILFTSGSEATPKGVMLSHNNLLASEISFSYALRIGPDDRMLMPSSLGHATGFLHGIIMPILTRATAVVSDVTDGRELAALVEREQTTCGMSVPTVIDSLVCSYETSGRPMSSMRFLCCGGSPVPRTLLERSRDLGVRLYSVYGATESAPHTMTTIYDDDERVISTDGCACPGMEIRVVNPETREVVPPGVEGEECSRGPAVFMGYLNHPELTDAVLDDQGWYYSGDLCVMDEDGYIRITGRRKDVVIRGGENISASEVEKVLMDHPAIKHAAVVAMPDKILGQKACAFLVARPEAERLTVADLIPYFISKGMAKFKIPERVEYLEEIPLTSSCKTDKPALRKIVEGFGLPE